MLLQAAAPKPSYADSRECQLRPHGQQPDMTASLIGPRSPAKMLPLRVSPAHKSPGRAQKQVPQRPFGQSSKRTSLEFVEVQITVSVFVVFAQHLSQHGEADRTRLLCGLVCATSSCTLAGHDTGSTTKKAAHMHECMHACIHTYVQTFIMRTYTNTMNISIYLYIFALYIVY